MPMIFTYSDAYGVEHTQAYAEIATFMFNNRTGTGRVTFFVWASKAAYDAKKQPFPDGVTIEVSGDKFLELAAVIGPTLVPVVYQQALANPNFMGATVV